MFLSLFTFRVIISSRYNFFTYENDLALVKTERRVRWRNILEMEKFYKNIFRFADNIIPICLPGNDDLLIGKY